MAVVVVVVVVVIVVFVVVVALSYSTTCVNSFRSPTPSPYFCINPFLTPSPCPNNDVMTSLVAMLLWCLLLCLWWW